MKHIKILILRVRLWYIDLGIVLNQKELYILEEKEIRLEKKLKTLGYIDITEREVV